MEALSQGALWEFTQLPCSEHQLMTCQTNAQPVTWLCDCNCS